MEILNCMGMSCPMPIIRLSKMMKELSSGDRLEVVADDPGFEPDVQAWCNKTGHRLISLETSGNDIKAIIEKT